MNRKYEILVLLNSNLEKVKLDKLIKDVEAKIAGNIVKKEDWGVKKLAYKIKKLDKAHYVLYYVETTPEAIDNLKEFIALNSKDVIRPIILKHEKKWPFEYKTTKDIKFPEKKNFSRRNNFEDRSKNKPDQNVKK